MNIVVDDIEKILGFELEQNIKDRIIKFDLEYESLSKDERDSYLLNVLNVLLNDITKSGKHRINEWENGWNQNLELFKETKNIEDLIPKYHGKKDIVRWMGDVIKPITENFDYKIHIIIVDAIIQYYLGDMSNIIEFGCGPAYHLIRLNEYKKDIKLYGSDWTKTSQNIINDVNDVLGTDITPFNFDFFNPDYNFNIPKNSGVYTVAALEQIGDNIEPYINYLLENKPELCVHMEPIDELLDDESLIDKLSILYFRKRNYLNGFLPYLEKLEKENKIEIIKKQRIYSGSYFIEGHSLIVWRPKK